MIEKIREALKKVYKTRGHRMLAQNAEMVLDMLESLEIKSIHMTIDKPMTIITFCVTRGKFSIVYEITKEGFKWHLI